MASAHSQFAVFVGVVEACGVARNGEESRSGECCRGNAPAFECFVFICLIEISHDHSRDDEEEVVGHLGMVCRQLQHCEECSECAAEEISAAVGEHDAGNRRRNVGEGGKFPDVSGADDYEEIRRKSVGDGSEQRNVPTQSAGKQQNVEAQHHDKHEVSRVG